MNRMTKWILANYNLTEEDLKKLPSVVAEIMEEIEQGVYVGDGTCSNISDSELADVLDEKLFV